VPNRKNAAPATNRAIRVGIQSIDAVIFDLDGVIVTTHSMHLQCWSELAREEGIRLPADAGERLRGIGRMESLDMILRGAHRAYSSEEKFALAERKNARYLELIRSLTPRCILPGARELLVELRRRGIRTALGSASRNAQLILRQLELTDLFDAIADGCDAPRSKPDPQVFLLAAERLGIPPDRCAVIEDATSGLEAARTAGMRAIGVGSHLRGCPLADIVVADLAALPVGLLFAELAPASAA
jgi:beta-phosphoglucomutase